MSEANDDDGAHADAEIAVENNCNDGLDAFSDTSNVDCQIDAPDLSCPSSNNEVGVAGNISDGPDTDLFGWFERHALPVTDVVKFSLDEWGVLCVEQLKLLPSEVFLGMFDSEKFIVKETAVSCRPTNSFVSFTGLFNSCDSHQHFIKSISFFSQKIALETLKEAGPVDLSKCLVAQAPTPTEKVPDKDVAAKPSPRKIPRNTKHMLEAQQTERQDPDPVLNDIVSLWSTTGHQNNLLRINVCNALRAGYTKAKIGRAVRVRAFGPWNGVGKSDLIYKKIKSTLLRIHNDMREGKFDDLNNAQNSEEYQKAMASKSVKVGARGRKDGLKLQTRHVEPEDNVEAPDLPTL